MAVAAAGGGLLTASAAPAAGATAAACSAWNGAQPAGPAPFSPLYSIAAVSACDVWAVGILANNHVASTDPAAGQQASFGQTVTLTVCGAVVINPTVTVPDVTGEDDASARGDITSAGLHVSTVTLKVACTIPRGTVLSQSPASGSTAPFGSSVNLTEATRSGSAVHQVVPHFCTQ